MDEATVARHRKGFEVMFPKAEWDEDKQEYTNAIYTYALLGYAAAMDNLGDNYALVPVIATDKMVAAAGPGNKAQLRKQFKHMAEAGRLNGRR